MRRQPEIPAARTWVATVHAADGVRLATTGRTRRGAIAGLAAYVGGRAPHVLWPEAAAAVRQRLDAGDGAGAVRHYFAAVGARWDDEWLTVLGGGPAG